MAVNVLTNLGSLYKIISLCSREKKRENIFTDLLGLFVQLNKKENNNLRSESFL